MAIEYIVSQHAEETAFLWLLLFVAPAISSGQTESATSEKDPFFETVDVNVVNVEVFVTDKKGNPIRGLTADDFEILEDRRPVKLTNFYAVEGGSRLRPRTVPEPPDAPPDPTPTFPAPTVDNESALPDDQRLFGLLAVQYGSQIEFV